MKYMLIALLLGFVANAHADSRDQKVQKLFEVQGLEVTYKKLIDDGRARTREQAKKLLDQMLTDMNPTQEFLDRMNRAADTFITSMQGTRTARDILDVMATQYAAQFSESELNQLIAFYQSAVAKKDIEVSRATTEYVIAYFKEADEKTQQAAVSQFIRALQMIAAECHCQRTK